MRSGWLAVGAWLPMPVVAVDLEAISRGLVEAGPWGKNAEVLPMLLGWLGLILLLALLGKLIYGAMDSWRRRRSARKLAHLHNDQWIMDIGDMLRVPPPSGLVIGGTPRAWQRYRQQIKQALLSEQQRNRQLAAQLDEQRRSS